MEEKVEEVAVAGDAKSLGTTFDIESKVRLYLPAVGYASVLAFSTHVTNPQFFRRYELMSDIVVS